MDAQHYTGKIVDGNLKETYRQFLQRMRRGEYDTPGRNDRNFNEFLYDGEVQRSDNRVNTFLVQEDPPINMIKINRGRPYLDDLVLYGPPGREKLFFHETGQMSLLQNELAFDGMLWGQDDAKNHEVSNAVSRAAYEQYMRESGRR